MKKLNFEKFTTQKVNANMVNKIKGGTHVHTTRGDGSGDWRDCETGTVTTMNGDLIGQGPTGCQ